MHEKRPDTVGELLFEPFIIYAKVLKGVNQDTYFCQGNSMAARAFEAGLRRGLFSQFTTKNISVVKK